MNSEVTANLAAVSRMKEVIPLLDNLIYSINAILPIFLLVVVGAVLNKMNKLSDSFLDVADWLVFNIALPLVLFLEVASCSLSDNIDVKLAVFLVVSVTSAFFLVSLLSVLFIKDRSKRGAFIQGVCRSNFAILGVPLAINMFGEAGGQAIAFATPIVIPMFNAYSVIVLSIFSGSDKHKINGKAILGILKNVVTNPLIIGILCGLPFMLTGIRLPTAADKTLTYLSNLATPLAMISLGAGFKLESLRGRAGYAVLGALGKTVILTAVAVIAAILVGLRGPSLGVVLICFGAPTAVSSYIMAKKMDNDHQLAAQILLLSTMVCIITIFLGIFILKSFAFI